MIRKILMVALFTCLGLALTGVAIFATYENRYQEILRLKRESRRIPEAERKAKAKAIAAKMHEKYEKTKYLSFKTACDAYWCKDGSLESRLPLDRWAYRQSIARFNLAMTPTEQRTEVFVNDEQVYTNFRRDGRYYEYKWPHNGVPGMYTDYPVKRDEPRNTRLIRGVDGGVLCCGGLFLSSWLGPKAHRAGRFKEHMELGSWIGTSTVDGEMCDVIFWDRPAMERWDVFYVNTEGLVVMWNSVDFDIADDKYGLSTMIKTNRYTAISTEAIPPATFSPSKALLEQAKTWRRLSDAESLAEMEKEYED